MAGALLGQVELGWTFPVPEFEFLAERALDAFAVPPDAYLFSDELAVLADAGLDGGVEGGGVAQRGGHFLPLGQSDHNIAELFCFCVGKLPAAGDNANLRSSVSIK